jgi:signal transduction histidine kinase
MKALAMLLATLILVCAPLEAPADDATSVELVNRAITLWKEKGKDYALKVINASAGPLKQGSMYTFALDFKGVILAHPAQVRLRGKNMWDVPDAEGKLITPEMVRLAQSPEGSGWLEYKWKRVNDAEPTMKRTFIKRVPGVDALVGCGYYLK